MPGRAFPAAQPQTELITIITVPLPGARTRSTSSGVRVSSTPKRVKILPHGNKKSFRVCHTLNVAEAERPHPRPYSHCHTLLACLSFQSFREPLTLGACRHR